MDDRTDILGVRVSVTNLALACETIGRWILAGTRTYVCVAPVSTVMECQDDPEYRRIVNNAGMVTPDGMPLVWLGRWHGHKTMARTYGPDLMLALCDASQAKGYTHYFYGGAEATIQKLIGNLQGRFPALTVAGYYSPPALKVNEPERAEVIARINAANPDVLWIGLGSPKQDYWMVRHRDQVKAPVMIGAGAAFDFHSGAKPQAPVWMQRSGLEWLFRLCCEPRRLWRRYLIGNTRFVFLLFQQCWKRN